MRRLRACPRQPLADLLCAFEQDVEKTRDGAGYADRAELLDYCRRSANPVGRLLLHLYGVDDATARWRSSDAICTALQLINFWQDLGRRPAARPLLPAGCRLPAPRRRPARTRRLAPRTAARRALVQAECDWARALMLARRAAGAPRAGPRRLGAAAAWCRAACASWTRSRRWDFDTLRARPALGALRCAAACCGAPCGCDNRAERMTPEQYVQEKAAASGSSFYYAFLFLPKPRRAAITAFYAFCREVDDVVDEVTRSRRRAHQAGLVADRSGAAPSPASRSTR